MTDEKFLFVTDCAEKKRTARGIHNKRVHTGKGGTVKFPSDYLSRKEREKMNGEVKSYNLGKPMMWKEFKTLPKDLQRQYLEMLMNKFNATNADIGAMFGVSDFTVNAVKRELNMPKSSYKYHGIEQRNAEKKAFRAWYDGEQTPGVNTQEDTAETETREPEIDGVAEIIAAEPEAADCPCWKIPDYGVMTFTGTADEILKTVGAILAGANVSLEIKWTKRGEAGA